MPPIAAPGLGGGRVLASHLISLPAAVFNCILLGVNHEKCDLSRLRDDHRG